MIPVRALNIGAVPLLLFSPLHTGKGLEEPSDRQQLASQCLFGLLIHAPDCGGRGGGATNELSCACACDLRRPPNLSPPLNLL
jgi:hypothetical protein